MPTLLQELQGKFPTVGWALSVDTLSEAIAEIDNAHQPQLTH
jgi:hypothetical protein